jgi:hypothetical protein
MNKELFLDNEGLTLKPMGLVELRMLCRQHNSEIPFTENKDRLGRIYVQSVAQFFGEMSHSHHI